MYRIGFVETTESLVNGGSGATLSSFSRKVFRGGILGADFC
jgi:hypothetical protein